MTKDYKAVKVESSVMLNVQNQYIDKLKAYANAIELDFNDYQKMCVQNAIRTVDPMLKQNDLSWNDLDVNNVMNVLQQIAFLGINPSANEVGLILRNQKQGNDWKKVLEAQIMGNGNDTILRNFGVDVKDVKSYEVYDGDEFEGVITDGWETKLPRHIPKYKSNKVKYSVYLIRKRNGEIDVSISEREDAKISLLANAKQNGADDEVLRELSKLSIDEILSSPKWLKYEIVKTSSFKNKTTGKWEEKESRTPLFNPSYTSPISSEKMLARKLRNHAIRRYPKDFGREEIAEIYEQTFEDERYLKKNVIDHNEILEIEEKNFEETANKQPLKNVDKPKGGTEKLVFKEEVKEVEEDEVIKNAITIGKEDEEEEIENEVVVDDEIEEIIEEESQQQNIKNDDVPDWMK